MLKQRVITAIVLALVFGGSILFADSIWVSALLAVMLFVATRELLALTVMPGAGVSIALALVFAALFWFLNTRSGIRVNFYQSYAGSIVWTGVLLYMLRYRLSTEWSLPVRYFHFLLGLFMLWVCVQGLMFLHSHFDQGGWILLYMLTLVWIADIGAYFSGRRFGRHKLAPGISPGKTREGVVGGLVCNLFWMLFVYWLSAGWGMSLTMFILVGLMTSAISVVGDLYESILKREAGVKDSGTLLPGHGGVLDRIDGVIAATPVFVSGLYAIGAV